MSKYFIKINYRQGLGLLNSPAEDLVYIKYNDEYISINCINDGEMGCWLSLEKEITLYMDGLDELAYDTKLIHFLELCNYDLYIDKNNKTLDSWIKFHLGGENN